MQAKPRTEIPALAGVHGAMRQVLRRLQSRYRQHAGDMCSTEQGLKLGSGEKMKKELESATSLRPVSECRGTVDLKVGILSTKFQVVKIQVYVTLNL